MLPGLVLVVAGFAFFTQVDAGTSLWLIGLALFTIGLGIGSTMMPTMAAAYQTLERADVARATTAFNIVQRGGGALGTALLSVVLASQLADRLPGAASAGEGLAAAQQVPPDARAQAAPLIADAFAHTYVWALALVALAAVPALFLPRHRAPAPGAAPVDDLHLTAGAAPMVRVRGRLAPVDGYPTLTPTDTREIIYSILSNDQRQRLETNWQLDFAYQIPGRARFRVNAYFQRSALGAAFRLIPFEIAPLDSLGLPPAVREMADRPRGLVLVTGPTGSGKSTTLASLIDVINESREEHIMTIEDPIEFLHRHKKCIVNQRELGGDAKSFATALKSALREDPDVILVGEMRDLETISTALTAAETGHLVFATLHTQDAPQTIDRIIDVFPAAQQAQVRVQLAVGLQGVVTQQLLPTADGSGRCVAAEVLVPTPAVRNLIREGKTHQIYSVLQTGGAQGMQTMDAALAGLVRSGTITRQLAEARSSTPEELRRLLGAAGLGAPREGAMAGV